jgi:hypothetical protein
MFGLLGIAGLMAKGQRASFEAFQRQQALALASDMAERILGNRLQAPAYVAGAPLVTPLGQGTQYGDYLNSSIKDCSTFTCSTTELAAYDIALWDGLLNGYSESQVVGGARVGGIVNALGCIEDTGDTSGTCPPPPAPTTPFTRSLRISVAWQGNEDTVVPTASTCGQGQYPTTARRRLVAINLTVLQPCN